MFPAVSRNEPPSSANICTDPVPSDLSASGQTIDSAQFLSASLWSPSVSEVFSQPRSGCSLRSGSFPRLCPPLSPQTTTAAQFVFEILCSPQRVYCQSFHIPPRLSRLGPLRTNPSWNKALRAVKPQLPALRQTLPSPVFLPAEL